MKTKRDEFKCNCQSLVDVGLLRGKELLDSEKGFGKIKKKKQWGTADLKGLI